MNIDKTQETTPAVCEKLEKVVEAQDDVLQQFIKTSEDLGKWRFIYIFFKLCLNYYLMHLHILGADINNNLVQATKQE